MLAAYQGHIVHPRLHIAGLLLGGVSVAANVLHFVDLLPGNPLVWASWLLGMAAYVASFVDVPRSRPVPSLRDFASSEAGLAVVVVLVYLATHLWHFPIAPWNANGLFDDAAWDIYFARDHAFSGPYQAAFYDAVGIISRETIFHYYITTLFKLFGYNLLVFNVALLVLGLVTVLFTALTVHRLFRSPAITIAAALIVNFLPLHYVHVFVGHRYAIAAPLMMVSLYFLYSGFQDRSGARVALSACFAALCFGSAIMGKQVIAALAGAAVLLPLLDRSRWRQPEIRALGGTWIVAFLIAATPLLVYIAFNREIYFRREQGLLGEFITLFREQGYAGVKPFVDQLVTLFLAPDTHQRMWLHDFPLVPAAYWLLLIPGLVIAALKRRFEIVFLATIPVASALLSGAFDFRVLLAAPIWVIAVAYGLDGLSRALRPDRDGLRRLAPIPVLGVVVLAGLLPSIGFLWRISQETHYQYLLRHSDVAVSRLIQDVVAGSTTPTADMKVDEFNQPVTAASREFDALVCPEHAYAIAHLYLQPFDDRRILTFCDGGNQALLGEDGVLAANIRAVLEGELGNNGLKLIWEESELAAPAMDWFAQFGDFGSTERFEASVDGQSFSIRVLTIPRENAAAFREAVSRQADAG